MKEEEPVIIPIDLEKISNDVLKNKAMDDKTSVEDFGREIKKHEKVIKKMKKPR